MFSIVNPFRPSPLNIVLLVRGGWMNGWMDVLVGLVGWLVVEVVDWEGECLI